jgi:hypothetical protein
MKPEAGILPLNYSRLSSFSSTCLFLKDLIFLAPCLYCPLGPCQTMLSDRKVDTKTDTKRTFIHFTTDSIYHSHRVEELVLLSVGINGPELVNSRSTASANRARRAGPRESLGLRFPESFRICSLLRLATSSR